jgi:oligogalacturonide lyase
MSNKGRTFPSEARRTTDPQTGAAVWQITDHPSIHHGLYPLTPSMTPDGASVIFASDRDGRFNFYRAAFPDGPIVQLTDGDDILGYSGTITRDGRRFLYTQAGRIRALDLQPLDETDIAAFPGAHLGEVCLSADETRAVCAARYDDGSYGIATCRTDGRESRIILRLGRVIIHPQFHPIDPDWIEYAADPAPRMHRIRLDGTGNELLYDHDNDEYVVHETWLGRTGVLVYVHWPYRVIRFDPDTRERRVITEFNAWHISPSADGTRLVCDTNHPDRGLFVIDVETGERQPLCESCSSNGGSQWTKSCYALAADFEEAARRAGSDLAEQTSWTDMKTDTVYGPQWTHPHPAFSHNGEFVTFTSDRTGHPQLYVVALPRHLQPGSVWRTA